MLAQITIYVPFIRTVNAVVRLHQQPQDRARKLYTSARIYEWKFGKGEWKLPFASPTRRVDFFGFVIIFEGKKELTSMFYSLQKQRKHSDRSVGFKCH